MPNPILLEKYAKLAVTVGANVQKDQMVVIRSTTEAVELTREIVKEAYKVGASKVHVVWGDEYLSKYTYDYADEETLKEVPAWSVDQYKYYVSNNAAFISVVSPIPNVLKGVSGDKIKIAMQASAKPMQFFREHTMGMTTQWTLIAASNPSWASVLFPSLDPKIAVEKLWDAIFNACRVNINHDPKESWDRHNQYLSHNNKVLNDHNFKYLNFKNSLGTDLRVELIKDHIWAGGTEVSRQGVSFNPNIPTEESFTMPNKWGTEGKVYATKPLNYQGRIIENFYLEFKDGKVVNFDAEKEKEALESILNFDENARYIGEIALISHDSPISNTDILFLNTLYDENASCHMALGKAYPMNIKDGHKLSIEELEKIGYNNSYVHVDFMFGSSDLEVIGIKHDGTEVVVIKDGNIVL